MQDDYYKIYECNVKMFLIIRNIQFRNGFVNKNFR